VKRRLPFGRAPVDEEVERELAFHLEMTARALIESGMSPARARAEAERRFGNVEAVKAESVRYGNERDARERRAELLSELRGDVAFAIRQLGRARGFTAVAILTLALGIGATAAVFSALDAVVLRPLPFPHPERVVELRSTERGEPSVLAGPEFLAMQASGVFEHVAGAVLGGASVMRFGELPEVITSARVSASYFAVFGAQAQLGRTFSAEEDVPGGPMVVVMSHRMWSGRFNRDPGIVGRSLLIDDVPHVVLGVMPASFDFKHESEDLWVPLALTAQQATGFMRFFRTFARLRPGIGIEQATAASTVVERRIIEQLPGRTKPVTDWAVLISPFVNQLVGDFARTLTTLLGAVGFVLLIACSNVANLLLARGESRSKELAIRAALGASRPRLVRQLLTESLVLATMGALLGLSVAYGLQRLIVAVSPRDVPRLDQARIDWRVLAFTLLLGVASAVLFGLVPALRAASPTLQGTLREGGRQSGSPRERIRRLLVAFEVAMAITLLVGAGLLIRSALEMQRVSPGFEPRGVLTARVLLPATRYPSGAEITRFFTSLHDEAARIPGVRSAALVAAVPMSGGRLSSPVRAEGRFTSKQDLTPSLRLTSSGYFATMGIPVLAGRDLSERDDASAPRVAVVNAAFVRALWPGMPVRDAVGKRFDAIGDQPRTTTPRTIVGIVGDTHDDALDRAPSAEFHIPYQQTPNGLWPYLGRSLVVVVRGATVDTHAETLVTPLRQAVARIDPSLPLVDARTMTGYLADTLQAIRMNTLLLSLLGAIALALAMVGIYGVVAYFVVQRTREIGLRMALGASPSQISGHVIRRGLAPVIAGLAAGIALSFVTARVLEGRLFAVSAHDPATLGGVALLLLLVGLSASYLPARRAMRIPPAVALNEG
jgi:putative ABC transport system permease protein